MTLQRIKLGRTGLTVSRMGIAGGYGLPAEEIQRAMTLGVNYFWWDAAWKDTMSPAIQSLSARQRKKVIVAAGSDKRDASGMRRALEKSLADLGVDYFDLFIAYYIDSEEQLRELVSSRGGVKALRKAQEEGLVRFLAFTAHNRPLAAKIAETNEFDVAIVRYNAAHRGGETEMFPAFQRVGCGVSIYTPLRWGELLKAPRRWKGNTPQPHEFYRFVLEHPAVHTVWTAPQTGEQLDENLRAAAEGFRLSPQRLEELQAYGQLFREEMA
jgi:predicted aldo/keto reductase-like oxidoreductase